MLLTITMPGVQTISVIVKFQLPSSFQPTLGAWLVNFPGHHNISGQWVFITILENKESSRNIKFRVAVQFMQRS